MVELNKATITEHIKVYIRQRPLDNNKVCDVNHSSVKNFTANGDCSYFSALQKKKHDFKFEGFLDHDIEQCEVYNRIAKPIVDSAIEGYSGTIFAYGPTNSGKTLCIFNMQT
jgi:hypothetical protein